MGPAEIPALLTVRAPVSLSAEAAGTVIADAILVNPMSAPPSTFTWLLDVPESAIYEVFLRWTAAPDRAPDATFTLTHDNGTEALTVNQQTDGATWVSIGSYPISVDSGATLTLDNDATGYVIADAVKLVPVQ